MIAQLMESISKVKPIGTCSYKGMHAVRIGNDRFRPASSVGGILGSAQNTHRFHVVPLATAISEGRAGVSEVDGGRVPNLRIRNSGRAFLFGMAGELVTGGRQDRVLNTSVLIAPGANVVVPVSCVEEGRWRWPEGRGRQGFRSAGASASTSVRSAMHKSVVESLSMCGRHETDQGGIWREVTRTLHGVGYGNTTTGALTSSLNERNRKLDGYVRTCAQTLCGNDAEQMGLALFTPWTPSAGLDGFSGLDCFGSPELLDHYAGYLVRGAALEAEQYSRPFFDAPVCSRDSISVEATQCILNSLTADSLVCSRPAAGGAPGAMEFHYSFLNMVASIICHEGRLIHFSVTSIKEGLSNNRKSPSPQGDVGLPLSEHSFWRVPPKDTSEPVFTLRIVIPTHGTDPAGPGLCSEAIPLSFGTYIIGRGHLHSHSSPNHSSHSHSSPNHSSHSSHSSHSHSSHSSHNHSSHSNHSSHNHSSHSRTTVDISIAQTGISRRHAKLKITPEGCSIQDLNSTNGTWVNGEEVVFTELKPNDQIMLGSKTWIELSKVDKEKRAI